jgi:DNA-binding response OmpR family regulator
VHILLVEDDDRVAAALRPALHRHGMTTTRLARGREAPDHLGGVDVVLLDLGLPDIDGVDVCRAIRERSDVPVIVVSARGEVDDRIQGLHCGADDYLVKPFDTGELLARMHAVLRRRSPTPAPGEPGEVVTRTFLGAVTRFVVGTAQGEVTVDAVTRPGLPEVGEPTIVRLDTDRVRAAT